MIMMMMTRLIAAFVVCVVALRNAYDVISRLHEQTTLKYKTI